VVNNWTAKDPIRIYFGAPLDMTRFLSRPNHLRTYKEIADFVMSKIVELGENDRRLQEEIHHGDTEITERVRR
ncbi:MAG: hypothetical protein ACRD63_07085, partial [Pyrinomonadaceae bacterium]